MKDIAKRVFDIEIESLQHVAGLLDDAFTGVVQAILNSKGKVIVIGALLVKKLRLLYQVQVPPAFFYTRGMPFMATWGL
jgi:arabinose-5-phosphate isomerase